MTNDIYPKLLEKWVKNAELQVYFSEKCEEIIELLNKLEIPKSITKSEIKDLMAIVASDLNLLQLEISQIENSFVRCVLQNIINKAITFHLEAIEYLNQDIIDLTIILEKITEVKLKISESFTEFVNYFELIEPNLNENLISRMNTVEINLNLILFNLPAL